MRLSKIRDIFKKEVLDTLRDRRTIMMMIVIPVLLYPILLLFISELAATQQAKMEKKTIRIALVNVPVDSDLYAGLMKDKRVEIVDTKKPMDEVRSDEIHFVIEVPPDASRILQNSGTVPLKLYLDRSNDDATTNLPRIKEILDAWSQKLLGRRLSEKSLSVEYVTPVTVEEVNVASKQKMGGFIIGRILPMLMVFMVLAGSFYPAIDMTAGEKERGTLETILTSPTTRTEIVLGKFLTVTLIAVVTGLLNVASMSATFAFGLFREASMAVQVKIPAQYVLIMVACLVPQAVFFSGMMMAVAGFARSYKEAQNLLTPIYLVATIPAMVSVVPGIQLEGFWLTLPVANVTLLFKELMLGVFNLDHVLIVFLSVTFLASVALFVAVKLFGREEVLFGEVSSFGLTLRHSNIAPKAVPGASEALFFIMVSMILLLYVGIPLQVHDLASGVILTELLIFLGLPVALAVYMKLDFRETFRLRVPAGRYILVAVMFWVGIALCSSSLLDVQNRMFPFPKQLMDYMEKLLAESTRHSFASVFLVIAVLPAICEEATFRGVLQSGLLTRFRPASAIFFTAVLFAAFHLSLYRFFPVFLIGLAACYLVYRSGSIFTSMLLHMLNNGLFMFFSFYPKMDHWGVASMNLAPGRALIGLALIAVGVLLAGERKEA